jgi:hypothetical protein
MQHHFRGPVRRPGVRPVLDLHLTTEDVQRLDGGSVDPVGADWLRVLHYGSHSGEEVVRRWMAKAIDGGAPLGAGSGRLRRAVRAVVHNPVLGPERKESLLRELYARHVADDADSLERLGYLSSVGPAPEPHRPAGLSEDGRATLDGLLDLLRAADKRHFLGGRGDRTPAALLTELRGQLRRRHPLAKPIDVALGR